MSKIINNFEIPSQANNAIIFKYLKIVIQSTHEEV